MSKKLIKIACYSLFNKCEYSLALVSALAIFTKHKVKQIREDKPEEESN